MFLKTFLITEEQLAQMFPVFYFMKYILMLFGNSKNFSMWVMQHIETES